MIGENFSPNVEDPIIQLSAKFSTLLSPQEMTYEGLHDYQNIQLISHSPFSSHRVLRAIKISTQEQWYLTLRRSEFTAQLDKAMSEVFRKYIPDTPETTLVKDGKDFYLASRAVENIVFCVEPNAQTFDIFNFGCISVLTHFIADRDFNSCNVIISDEEYPNFVARKIDHEESLEEEILQENNVNLEDILDNHWNFPPAIVNHYRYKTEQLATLDSLCKTPFSEISSLIKKYVRSSDIDTKLTLLQKRHERYQATQSQKLNV